MQTNNNPVVEIGVILIALGFIAAGTTLLALHTIDLNVAIILWTLAGTVAGINVAIKAPSPTQQAALLQLTSQALQAQAQPQLVQAPAPVATPQVVQMPFNPASSAAATPQFVPLTGFPLAGGTVTMPQAIQTTMTDIPVAGKPQ